MEPLKSTRAIQEQIQELAIEGRALGELLDKDNGPHRAAEAARFDEITTKLVPDLRNQLKDAEDRERRIAELTEAQNRQNRRGELDELLKPVNRSSLVLPIHGRDPQDVMQDSPQYFKTSKLRAFQNERDAYTGGMWLRAICSHGNDKKAIQHCNRVFGMDVVNTAVEGSGAEGGFLVPAQLAAAIIDVRERVGVARQVCDIQPMTSDTLSVPKRATGYTVYYPGEGVAITASDMTKSQVSLSARKRAVLGEISQELQDDALVSVADNAFSEMGYALALKEDEEFIDGNGQSTMGTVKGLKQSVAAGSVSTAATGHDTWGELDMADVAAWIGLLPDRFDRMPSIVCSRAFYWNVLRRLDITAGGNTTRDVQEGDGGRRTFQGYPVHFTHFMPTSTAAATVCAFFGDFSMGCMIGDRTGIRVARDDSIGFARDVITLRAISRYDINIYEPGTASAAGAFVALKTAS